MEQFKNLIGEFALPVFTAGVVSFLIQIIAQRFTILPSSAGRGLYLLVLPLCCSLFGVQLASLVTAFCTLAGLSQIIWTLRRSKAQHSPAKSECNTVSRLGDT